MRRLGPFAVQRRGPLLDVWTDFGKRPARVICVHGRTWREGGLIDCVRCLDRIGRDLERMELERTRADNLALIESGSKMARERDRYREALTLIAGRDYGAIEDKETARIALYPVSAPWPS